MHWPTMPDEAHAMAAATGFLIHAVNTVPYYRKHLSPLWTLPLELTGELLLRLPLLMRRHLQDHHAELISSAPPSPVI